MMFKKDLNILIKGSLLIWKSSSGWTVARVFVLLSQAIVSLGYLYLLKIIIDDILTIIPQGKGVGNFSFTLVKDLVMLAGIFFLSSANDIFSKLISTIQQQKLTDYLQHLIHKKSSEVDFAFFEEPNYHNNFHLAQKEAMTRPDALVDNLSRLGMNIFTLAGISILLFSLHWWIIFILIISFIPKALLKLKFAQKIFLLEEKVTAHNRLSNYISSLLSGTHHAKEIRVFNFGETLRNKFTEIRNGLLIKKIRMHSFQVKTLFFVNIFQISAIVFVFYFIALDGIDGVITVGSIVMLFQAVLRTQGLLTLSVNSLVEVYEQKLFLGNLFGFLEINTSKGKKFLNFPERIKYGIKFSGVSFKYNSNRHSSLKNIHLEFIPGQIIALVGTNGSGKSSLLKLLCGLYKPQSGKITLEGIDFSLYERYRLWQMSTVIFQDFARFEFSLKFNITGSDENIDVGRMEMAVRKAGCEEIVKKLSNGYDTILGNHFEKGQELSGGEWQRIALARLFYKDSQLIILDEPTNFMDGTDESGLLHQLSEIKKDKIIIIVSHRLSNIKTADIIYVMRNGEIVAGGKHNELMDVSPDYVDLFKTQIEIESKELF